MVTTTSIFSVVTQKCFSYAFFGKNLCILIILKLLEYKLEYNCYNDDHQKMVLLVCVCSKLSFHTTSMKNHVG